MKKLFPILFVIIFLFAADVYTQTVYVTKSGKKYHKYDCRYLNKSKIPIDLSEAIDLRLSPCKVCKPVNDGIDLESDDQSVRCNALTKKGTRCKRQTKYENGLCWQHQGN